MPLLPLSIALLLTTVPPVQAREEHSSSSVRAFKHRNPCPVTGEPRGPCPGHIVVHIVPLCAGGPDWPGNMQWQTLKEAKAKEREERKLCGAERSE